MINANTEYTEHRGEVVDACVESSGELLLTDDDEKPKDVEAALKTTTNGDYTQRRTEVVNSATSDDEDDPDENNRNEGRMQKELVTSSPYNSRHRAIEAYATSDDSEGDEKVEASACLEELLTEEKQKEAKAAASTLNDAPLFSSNFLSAALLVAPLPHQPQVTSSSRSSVPGAVAVTPNVVGRNNDDADNNGDLEQQEIPGTENNSNTDQDQVLATLVNSEELRLEFMSKEESKIRNLILQEAVTATQVTQVKEDDGPDSDPTKRKRKRRRLLLGLVALALIALAVFLAVWLPNRNDNKNSSAVEPSSTDTEGLTQEEFLIRLVHPEYQYSDMADIRLNMMNAPQSQRQAIQWMLGQDPWTYNLWYGNNSEATPLVLGSDPLRDAQLIERYALAVLYFSTDSLEWSQSYQFLTPQSVCEWQPTLPIGQEEDFSGSSSADESESNSQPAGVHCNGVGLVSHVVIPYNNLNGTIPRELASLVHLEQLVLSGQLLHSTIPSQIGSLSRLEGLRLADNSLTGSVAPEMGQSWEQMQALDLTNNHLTGTIPSTLTQLPRLQELNMGENAFTGTIPDFLENSGLWFLHLQHNLLTGSMPESVWTLRKLEELTLGLNMLTGTLAPQFGNLAILWLLELYVNLFSGTLPTRLGEMRELVKIYLDHNQFTGRIPTEIGNLQRLGGLGLSQNLLTGGLPAELVNCKQLFAIDVNTNLLNGTIPVEYASFKGGVLALSDNSFTGSLDALFCNRTTPIPDIETDCLPAPNGSPAEVECSCCVFCCNDSKGNEGCELNVAFLCEKEASRVESFMKTPTNDPQCTCEKEGHAMACVDSQCQSCSQDGSLCAIPTYGITSTSRHNGTISVVGEAEEVDEEMHRFWQCDMQYVTGRSELVSMEFDTAFGSCSVAIDGVACDSCSFKTCSSGLETWRVDCSNVEASSVFDPCEPDTTSGGLLLASFNEEFWRSETCRPCWLNTGYEY